MQTHLRLQKGGWPVVVLFLLMFLQLPLFAAGSSTELRVESTPDSYTYLEAGQSIAFNTTITNPTSESLTDIEVAGPGPSESHTIPELAAGASGQITHYLQITADDMRYPKLISEIHAEGKDLTGGTVSASEEVTLFRANEGADVTITKTAEPQVFEHVGDTITYKIFVHNTGAEKLYNINVTDELTADHWSVTDLNPGDSQGFIAYYRVKQVDMDLGYIINVAEVTAEDGEGNVLNAEDEETVVAMTSISQLTITKTATPTEFSGPGELIEYQIIVVNTGINRIFDIVVNDALTTESWNVTDLAAGDNQGFTAYYKTTQADYDNGEIVNVADVSGHDEDGFQVYDSDQVVITALGRNAEMAFASGIHPTTFANPGEVVAFEMEVKNAGNITLFDVELEDSFTGSNWYMTSLAPGKEQSFSASHTISQSDIDIGAIETRMTAESMDPDGNMLYAEEEHSSNLLRIPGGLTPDTAFDSEFVIEGLQYYPQNSLKVYNRQGTLVYEAAPYQNDWDGTPNRGSVALDPDGKLPGGTYFYLLKLSDDEDAYTGYIYLIKQ